MTPLRHPILALCLLAIWFLGTPSVTARLYITEFMADNRRTIEDEDGDASDWIEIFNSGTDPVSLEGYFLTDSADTLTMWSFPAADHGPSWSAAAPPAARAGS